jgi:hypothetical protein
LSHSCPNISTADLFEHLCDDFLTNHDDAIARAARKDSAQINTRPTKEAARSGTRQQTSSQKSEKLTESLADSPAESLTETGYFREDQFAPEQGVEKNHALDIAVKNSTKSKKLSKFQEHIKKFPAPRENGALRSRRKYIPAQIQRKIWSRDQGRCRHCDSTRFLEIDHIIPLALGGSDEPDNLRILCRPCNQRAAIETFGSLKMQTHFEQNLVGP